MKKEINSLKEVVNKLSAISSISMLNSPTTISLPFPKSSSGILLPI
jgi:hypothetical protein